MKTIEERAWEIYPKKYRDVPIARTMEYAFDVNEDSRKGFVAGAQSEHEELTRWNSPKRPPKPLTHVLVKYEKPIVKKDSDIAYAIGYCEFRDCWRFVDEKYHQALDTCGYKFIGWREIQE